jgi:hypothetical protein
VQDRLTELEREASDMRMGHTTATMLMFTDPEQARAVLARETEEQRAELLRLLRATTSEEPRK